MKRTAWDVGSGLGSAYTSQAVGWMSLVNTWENAYSPPTLDRWSVDSGATHSMTLQPVHWLTYCSDLTTVTVANNRIVMAAGRGDEVQLLPSGDITLKEVLNILSIAFSLLLEGADLVMYILNAPDIIPTVTQIGHCYVFHTKWNPGVHAALATALVPIRSSPTHQHRRKSADWLFLSHRHLGPIGFKGIKLLAKDPASVIKLSTTVFEACAA